MAVIKKTNENYQGCVQKGTFYTTDGVYTTLTTTGSNIFCTTERVYTTLTTMGQISSTKVCQRKTENGTSGVALPVKVLAAKLDTSAQFLDPYGGRREPTPEGYSPTST